MFNFLVWAVCVFFFLLGVNVLLPLPLRFWLARKSANPTEAEREQAFVPMGYGFVAGVLVGLLLVHVTLEYFSVYWWYQVFLVVGFFAASEHPRQLYWKKARAESGAVEQTRDEFTAVVFSWYFWGALVSLLVVNVVRWLR